VKDFKKWTKIKYKIENQNKIKFFKEREIWWISMGLNIGHEEDGKGEYFQRPVILIKKYNKNSFLCLAITTKNKNNKYHFSINLGNKKYFVILSQVKFCSSKRLINRIGIIDKDNFLRLKKEITRLNFE